MMSYDSSNMEIQKGYKTPFRRSGHIYRKLLLCSVLVFTLSQMLMVCGKELCIDRSANLSYKINAI